MIASRALSKTVARSPNVVQQRRSFIDWMTKYPDHIKDVKQKYHSDKYAQQWTWLKESNDKYVNAAAVVLCSIGMVQLVSGTYKLATGKGKTI